MADITISQEANHDWLGDKNLVGNITMSVDQRTQSRLPPLICRSPVTTWKDGFDMRIEVGASAAYPSGWRSFPRRC